VSLALFTVAVPRRSKPDDVAAQLAGHLGVVVRTARAERHWTLAELAQRAGLSAGMVHKVETAHPASLLTYARLAEALDRQAVLELVDPRRRGAVARSEDPVHAAMGELEARRISGHRRTVVLDEPFQHYQFAGRADVVAFDLERGALLHIENRTRFPNLQEAFGSYNTKRQYLAAAMTQRLGLRGGWDTVTHVVVALWSAEVLHAVRLRESSFRSVCPHPTDDFVAWWNGALPDGGRTTSALVFLDPLASADRRATFVGLEELPRIRPRYRGYAEAHAALVAAGQA
jgi:transcriptional regulator with XRE-family HTH domain